MSDKTRPQWLLPAGIGALVLVLVVIALLREPVELDPSTPEGTVQAYLQAIGEDDYGTALETLDPQEFGECVPGDLARATPDDPFTANLDGETPSETVDPDATSAVVSVRMRFGTDGMLGSTWETVEIFDLVAEGGSWLITGDPWPHFSWQCSERGDL